MITIKQQLKQVYDDLACGKLSRKHALEQIRALKLQMLDSQGQVALLKTQWRAGSAARVAVSYAQRQVLVCETGDWSQLQGLLPGSRCVGLGTVSDASRQGSLAERYERCAVQCFEQVRGILQSKVSGPVLVQVVVRVSGAEGAVFAGLAGLLKTAALENPQIHGQLILSESPVAQLALELEEDRGYAQDVIVRHAGGQREVLGWQVQEPSKSQAPIAFKDGGVYLITGGLGGLGRVFAREIFAQTSQARVIVTGRGELDEGKQRLLKELESLGAVQYRSVELGDARQVRGLVAGLVSEHGQLNGIVHSAGMIADNFILKKSAAEFEQVLGPKVHGTYALDEASATVELDFLVLFSSVAGALGNVGQADYAAGNGFMDGFAAYRNERVTRGERHGRTLSINWPLWEAGGMRIEASTQALLEQSTGLKPLATAAGLEAFYQSLALTGDQALVLYGAAGRLLDALEPRARATPPTSATAPTAAPAPMPAAIESSDLLERTQDYLRKQLSQLLKLPAHKIDPQAPLEQYGIDSILAMNLTNQLEKTFGSLSKTLFFEYRTLAELSTYFIQTQAGRLSHVFSRTSDPQPSIPTPKSSDLAPSPQNKLAAGRRFGRPVASTGTNESNRAPLPTNPSNAESIAIIGLSGRYPESIDLEAYWNNLRQGKDCITEIPPQRWDWREHFSADRSQEGRHFSKWGGFIEGVDEFDPLFFNISPREAKSMDPQERLFLQHAWMAVEDAGYTRARLQMAHQNDLPGQVGVYVGVMYGEYNVSGSLASIANRVSYVLNLHGPSVILDTMCSSSLTAIHLACQDLKQRRTDLAIAGGVNVSVHPNKYKMLSAGQFISSDGHCQSFGEGGDGYIPGEGVGALILRRLSEALEDGQHIYGIIRGSALNHGGKTNGFSVPNPQAQASAIKRALVESDTDPRHISYIEAHGTGTKLGDPIEIAALSRAFQDSGERSEPCAIGSAKSNIGHCESAAGIAGLTKLLLQLQHREIVPSLHSTRLNPHIDFAQTPFVVNQTAKPWNQPIVGGRSVARIGGVSSFGAGGSNAHVIVEEFPPTTPSSMSRKDQQARFIIPLSARTPDQLRRKVGDLLEFIANRAREKLPVDLAAMAYTLQVGREAMEERLGFIVGSMAQLTDKLDAYLGGDREIEDYYQGQVKRDRDGISIIGQDDDMKEAIERWLSRKKLNKLVEFWVKGLELNWNSLHAGKKPQFISLPTYPFARDRYWIDVVERQPVRAEVPVPADVMARLHPLVHSNTSTLSHQSYQSTFSGGEFFFSEPAPTGGERVAGKLFIQAAHLEMARAAVELAMPGFFSGKALELRDVMWGRPAVMSDGGQLCIALARSGDEDIEFEIFSRQNGEEIIHCQGRVLVGQQVSSKHSVDTLRGRMVHESPLSRGVYAKIGRDPEVRSIGSIHVGDEELIARLQLSPAAEAVCSDYRLHPSLVDGALLAASALIEDQYKGALAHVPIAVQSVRIGDGCGSRMVAWVRRAVSSASHADILIDIDLCDDQGKVSIQFLGLRYALARLDSAVTVAEETPPVPGDRAESFHEPKRLSFAIRTRQSVTLAKKPAGIRLAGAAELAFAGHRPQGKQAKPEAAKKYRVALSDVRRPEVGGDLANSSVGLFDYGMGVLAIQMAVPHTENALSSDLSSDLLQALNAARAQASLKVLMILGSERWFARGGQFEHNHAVESGLYTAIAEFPSPVIAVLQGSATGAGFLIGALCDFMICSVEAEYRFADEEAGFHASARERALFDARFGRAHAHDFLYVADRPTGADLRSKGWSCPILPRSDVAIYAKQLAASLATKSQESLRLLKLQLGRRLLVHAAGLTVHAGRSVPRTAADSHLATIRVPAITSSTASTVLAELARQFGEINDAVRFKCVVLVTDRVDDLAALELPLADNFLSKLQDLVIDCRIPVIAALTSSLRGMAWIISEFCDGCVYSRAGRYASAAPGEWLSPQASVIFGHRFGAHIGAEILLVGGEYSGTELQQKIAALCVVDETEVLSTAVGLAHKWSWRPRTDLLTWKRDMSASTRQSIESYRVASESRAEPMTTSPPTAPTSVGLTSKVIKATAHPEGILVIAMEDRSAKNMFSAAFIEGMNEVFAHIETTPHYKAVVLIGYDHYFASGGTKEGLLAIQEGKAKFTDVKIFQLPLECRIPVICAMQGHGIGAGWSMGMYGDVILFSQESTYLSPYMKYGFTPGAGSTLIFPERIGYDLARETLLTADENSGGKLKARGISHLVVPRAQTLAAAMTLARRVARHTREHLMRIKYQLTGPLRELLAETYDLELAMHEKTFVGQSETLRLIKSEFSQRPVVAGAIERGAREPTRAASKPPASTLRVEVNDLGGILATLRGLLCKELHMQEEDIDKDAQFVDIGLDSISGVTWVRNINECYHTSIEATKVYSHPTLLQFARHLQEEVARLGKGDEGPAPVQADSPIDVANDPDFREKPDRVPAAAAVTMLPLAADLAPRRLSATWGRLTSSPTTAVVSLSKPEPIAIIGMAGQFPQAKSVDEFWKNIVEGRNCIREVDPNRWDPHRFYQAGDAVTGKTNSRWLGALEEYDLFDPLFFNISPVEAASMDPQQRVFLQTCWHSIEDAGYNPQGLSGTKCGVFVGCAGGDYQQLSRDNQLSAQGFTGSAMSILAARISYFLNLQGPCLSIDTACSSALVAIAHACDSLNSGGSDLALAGGVYVMSGPDLHIKTAQAGMLSPDGQCFSFDRKANGFVPGEAVGVVVLKRLADAERDHDVISGVIEGWGVNQDGRTNGITAPNPDSQSRLQQDIYERHRIDPADIELIEAHGTGTQLGDPIEVEGLKKSFGKYTQKRQYCALGSVKSNIGHCLTAAGIAGLIKVTLALKHRQLPPTINFHELNEHIGLSDSPFYINSRLTEWRRDGAPRRYAAVSSFGFSGTNAHIVVGEYVSGCGDGPAVSVVTQNAKIIVPLSAKTPEQLKQKASDLLQFLRERGESLTLLEVAYTLQVGREAMGERAGFLVDSFDQLQEKLDAFIGSRTLEDSYRGQVKRSKEGMSILSEDADMREALVDKWIAHKRLSKILGLWVRGLELDWNKLYGPTKPNRTSLPTYPFAKERYWIDEGRAVPVVAPISRLSMPHEALTVARRETVFSYRTDEAFLSEYLGPVLDHRPDVFPGTLFLELAGAAFERSATAQSAFGLNIQNVVWSRPVRMQGTRQLSAALFANDDGSATFEVAGETGGPEAVHCQGRVCFTAQSARFVNLEKLKAELTDEKETDQRIVRLSEGRDSKTGRGRHALRSGLFDAAIQAARYLTESASLAEGGRMVPVALDSLCVLSPCVGEMLAWIRPAAGGPNSNAKLGLDIDICDSKGNVCLLIRGCIVQADRAIADLECGRPMTLLATAQWRAGSAARVAVSYAQRQVLVCETGDGSQLQGLLPGSRCVGLGTVSDASRQGSLAERYERCAVQCFEQVRGILQSKVSGPVLVQVVVRVSGAEGAVFAGLAGLLKTAALENPQIHGQLILSESPVAQLALELEEDRGYAQDVIVRHAGGQREVLGWQVQEPSKSQAPIAFKDGGVYLITGGLGGLGRVFAREIFAQTSQARVIVTGRGELDEGKQRLLKELESLGAVQYRSVELGDARQVRGLVAGLVSEHGQLNGIVHSAGMIADNFILKKSAAEFAQVLGPKVHGTYALDEASATVELDFLVLFSSVAGALGNVGQADYAAGNGFMDGFAAYRNERVTRGERHGRTLSINWPLWEAGGMRIEASTQALLEQSTGLKPLATAAGLEAFYRSFALPVSRTLVMVGKPSIVTQMLTETMLKSRTQSEVTGSLDHDLLHEKTSGKLRLLLGHALKLSPAEIDAHEELASYGIDSLMIMKINKELERHFGTIPKTLFFEYSTLQKLVGYLTEHYSEECQSWTDTRPARASERVSENRPSPAWTDLSSLRRNTSVDHLQRLPPSATPSDASERPPIAIIGISGMYPQAATLEEFWSNLKMGRNCVTEIPENRWPLEGFYHPDEATAISQGKSYCKWGGFIDQFNEFDPLFFGMSPREAMDKDPQERLFLQASWHALENSGYTRADLQTKFNRRVGVFAGVTKAGFNLYGSRSSRAGDGFHPHTSFSSVANRVSYFMDITGPSMPIDTMCSSSLTAIHEACEHIHRGDCELAFAGGVNLHLHPSTYIDMSTQHALSKDGLCRSFGAGANGFVPGEGVGVILLKPLARALEDEDIIHGVILGTHVNHGGKTNGYTVPSPRAQAQLIRRTMEKAGVKGHDISYIEAHGTGTELGDPIEIEGLQQAMNRDPELHGFCKIGSAKSNIGHLEAAAGMAGLTKILLQMKHRQIAPSLHAETLNPNIDFATSSFVVNRTLSDWSPVSGSGSIPLRIAGISSFGAGGANAHIILQEHVHVAGDPGAAEAKPRRVIIPLSARTPEQLRTQACELLRFIRDEPPLESGTTGEWRPAGQVDLASLAFTLQTGREALEERLGFIVDSVDQLIARLTAFIHGDRGVEDTYVGKAHRGNENLMILNHDEDMREAVEKWVSRKKLSKLLEVWVRGLAFDWNGLYGESKPKRMELPMYPFAKERYWIDSVASLEPRVDCTELERDLASIDDILEQANSDRIETDHAVELLARLM